MSEPGLLHYLLLASGWLLYALLHSLLASLGVKRWVLQQAPGLMPAYRLAFNAIAVVLVLPLLWLIYGLDWPMLWRWEGSWAWLANGLALLAFAGFAWSLKYYDGGEFSGLKQWRGKLRSIEEQEAFHLSPLHYWVRHPWYSLALVLIWTRDMNSGFLLSALMMSAYFVIGSRFEERKLVSYYGDRYRAYQRRVPALVPNPLRRLDANSARRLLEDDTENQLDD